MQSRRYSVTVQGRLGARFTPRFRAYRSNRGTARPVSSPNPSTKVNSTDS